ncbi:MAG: hypothetical protein HYU99_04875 [Deltaproteobacteria bacterium]|nr:hypothetical protein [Deltaproteobacteria bacterium]
MQKMNERIQSKAIYKAFELMRQKKFDESEAVLTEGLKEAQTARDLVLTALFYSAYGVLFKLKKEYRKAWKYYEQAEKLIPDDPALKIISSRLLVDYFGQHDTVIRKMEKILPKLGNDMTFLHQAYTVLGLAYLKKGNKKKAGECLTKSAGNDFKGLQSGANFDFRLVEEMMKKKNNPAACRGFLEKALAFVKETKEIQHERILKRLLDLFPAG